MLGESYNTLSVENLHLTFYNITVTIIERSIQKFGEQRSLTREFFKQNLTEKQNGYLERGCLKELVAYVRFGRYEKLECRFKERMETKWYC